VFAALPAGSALAKTIGQTGGNVGCPPEIVLGDGNYVVPSGGGTITSFSFLSDSSSTGQSLDFLVLRPTGSGSYTVVGKTGLVTLAGTGLETFPANVSVRAGDILGFWARPGLHDSFPNCARSVPGGGGYLQSSTATNPKVGDTFTFPITSSFFDLNESATFDRRHVCSGSFSHPGVLKGAYPSGVVVQGVCEVNSGKAYVAGKLSVTNGSVLGAAFGKHQSSLTVAGNLVLGRGAAAILGCKVNANGTGQACLDDQSKHPTLTSHERILGSIMARSANGLIVHNSAIGGDIKDLGGGGGATCAVPKTGIFAAFHSPAFSDLEDSTVGGAVVLNGLRTCWIGLARDTIHGYATININKTADPDAVEVLSNHIAKSLSCAGNRHEGPQPKGTLPIWDSADAGSGLYPRVSEPNTVGGSRSGQCVKASPIKLGGPPAAKHF
jgi:hypothetical protein